MNKHRNIIAALALFSGAVTAVLASPRINVQPVSAGGTLYWNDPGIWTNGTGASVLPPTVANGANGHDIFIANDANVVFGRDDESSSVRYLKIGAMGNAGSLPSGLYADIYNPNGTLTIVGGTLSVTSSNFNVGDANPYAPAFWTDPIRGNLIVQGGTLNASTAYIGGRRGDVTTGGKTEGYFEQTGGVVNFTGSLLVGAASNAVNKENVNGVARFTGGTSTFAGLYAGALQKMDGAWTDEELAGRGHGQIIIGPGASINTGTLEMRLNSDLVFELGATTAFNPLVVTTSANFYEAARIVIDGSHLPYNGDYSSIVVMQYAALTKAADLENASFVGFDSRYNPSLEFVDNHLVLNLSGAVTPGPSTYLSNVSVRAAMNEGQTLIMGFVVAGGAKPVLVRTGGPVLNQFNLTGVADPRLTLYNAEGNNVAENNDWTPDLETLFATLGAMPFDAGSKDAALLDTLSGPHTMHAQGTGNGSVIAEAYDAGEANGPKLVNLSARYHVGTGNDVLIAGFVIAGSGKKQVLIRGIGPGLAYTFDLQGVLDAPKLTLYDADGHVVTSNDSWDSSLAPTFEALGAFELEPGSKDAALLVELDAGVYTAQVSGADGGTGEALVEIYDANP